MHQWVQNNVVVQATLKTALKMREMRGEVGKKTHEKEMDNPSFL